MKKSFALFLIIPLLLASCNSDDATANFPDNDPSGDPSGSLQKNMLLKRHTYVEFESGMKRFEKEFKYDENDRVVWAKYSIYDYIDGELNQNASGIFRYQYEDDRITASHYFLNGDFRSTRHYIQVDAHQFKQETYYPDEEPYIYVFHLDDPACGVTRVEGFDRNGNMEYYDDIEYLDENCSYEISTYDKDDNYIIGHIVTLVRSDRFQPQPSIMYQYAVVSPNYDAIEFISKNSSGTINENGSFKIDYEYNAYGYPTSAIRTYLGGNEKWKETMEYY